MDSKNHYTMSIGAMLHKCEIELTQLKEDLACRPLDLPRSYTPTATDPHSDSSAASVPARRDRRASTRKHAPIRVAASPRARSVSGFGMWRSIRRKSRHVSTESESDGDKSVELMDTPRRDDPSVPNRTPARRLTEAFVLPLHETLDANRQRYVSFSTPKKRNGRSDDDVFQITEQHQLV
ncbi:hypothetical protein COOONC_12977 [Cooperia oncophora]